jgi:DNA replication protein DnaC
LKFNFVLKFNFFVLGNSGVGKTLLIEAMLRSLASPEGNFVRQGTILGDVLQYNAARTSTTSKLAQGGEITTDNTESGGKNKNKIIFFYKFD